MDKNKPGFTLIEVLLVIALIGILATIISGAIMFSTRRKTAITAYRSSMQSLRRGIELCKESMPSGTSWTAAPGSPICGGGERYPLVTDKCGDNQINFFVQINSSGTWSFTSAMAGSGAFLDCQGCRLACDVSDCIVASAAGTCD